MDSSGHDPAIPDPPDPKSGEQRAVLAAIWGGGACLALAIIGITLLGAKNSGVNEVATTALASIGATLAGGFAGWIARGVLERDRRDK